MTAKKLLLTSLLLLTCASQVHAASMVLNWTWTPDPGNTLQVEKFVILRQSDGGTFTPICTTAPTILTCHDTALPVGAHCWKAQAWAGTLMAPESPAVCATIKPAQFIGTLILQTVPAP